MLHDLTLEGFGTRLVPLADEHAEPLSAFVDDRLWAGMSSPTPDSREAMGAEVLAAQQAPGRLAFAEKMAESTLARLKAIEPKLQAFYDSLDAKQKKAFDTGGRVGGMFDWWGKK